MKDLGILGYTGKDLLWEYFRAPCDRYATPEEMAESFVFLNSDMASSKCEVIFARNLSSQFFDFL